MALFLDTLRRCGALRRSLRDSHFCLNRRTVSFSAKRASFTASPSGVYQNAGERRLTLALNFARFLQAGRQSQASEGNCKPVN